MDIFEPSQLRQRHRSQSESLHDNTVADIMKRIEPHVERQVQASFEHGKDIGKCQGFTCGFIMAAITIYVIMNATTLV